MNLENQELPERGVVLLECLSNLTANEMFETEGAGEGTEARVLSGVKALLEKSAHLVIVTNDIFSDGITYDEVTALYQERLGLSLIHIQGSVGWRDAGSGAGKVFGEF